MSSAAGSGSTIRATSARSMPCSANTSARIRRRARASSRAWWSTARWKSTAWRTKRRPAEGRAVAGGHADDRVGLAAELQGAGAVVPVARGAAAGGGGAAERRVGRDVDADARAIILGEAEK